MLNCMAWFNFKSILLLVTCLFSSCWVHIFNTFGTLMSSLRKVSNLSKVPFTSSSFTHASYNVNIYRFLHTFILSFIRTSIHSSIHPSTHPSHLLPLSCHPCTLLMFGGMSNHQVLEEVERGYRMPKPQDTPDKLWRVNLLCWEREPDNRPTFDHLAQYYQEFESPDYEDENDGTYLTVSVIVNHCFCIIISSKCRFSVYLPLKLLLDQQSFGILHFGWMLFQLVAYLSFWRHFSSCLSSAFKHIASSVHFVFKAWGVTIVSCSF